MGMQDAKFKFSAAQASDNAGVGVQVISTNVYDAGSAKKLFAGSQSAVKVGVDVTRLAGTTPDLEAQFVGADDAALTTNVEVLAAARVEAGAAVPRHLDLVPSNQKTAKRYYGMRYSQNGNADNDFTVSAAAQLDTFTHV